MSLDLNVSYDDGAFDKDEQGWCARCVDVVHDGDIVTVRRHGDDNGLRAYDDTAVYRVGEVVTTLGLVRLHQEQASPALYFDLKDRRVLSPTKQVLTNFKPPPTYMTQAAREALAAALVPVAQAIGIDVSHAPPTLPIDAMAPSATAQGALEGKGTVNVGPVRWSWMRRTFSTTVGRGIGPEQLSVDVQLDGRHRLLVSAFVESSRKGLVVVEANLEQIPKVRGIVDAAIGAWRRTSG
jgi:hypothetical protein